MATYFLVHGCPGIPALPLIAAAPLVSDADRDALFAQYPDAPACPSGGDWVRRINPVGDYLTTQTLLGAELGVDPILLAVYTVESRQSGPERYLLRQGP